MWRDRTNLYISYRQSYAHHPAKKPKYSNASGNGYSDSIGAGASEERRGLMSPGAFEDDGDAIIEMDLLPPRWADISDEVTEYLTDIANKSQKLEKLHQKHVLPGFDDEEIKKKEEREIELLTQQITKGFSRLSKSNSESRTDCSRFAASRRNKVQEASAGFRKKQSTYLKKLRGLGGMNAPIERASTPLYTIMQREREINDIAEGIIELADIFKELQTMIIDQGTMLDRIDYNVERMAVDVKAANVELKVASGYQRRGTKRRIILLLILLVVGMFILLLVKPKKHRGEVEESVPPPSPP
ncbi:hypothetical protein EYC84_001992 [Monilinia fructicola]|uniref:t-SNARE coiled-coil homology domain-containing protein n=1 Tax=Monilinia fructicola TaxID=38448 RepID=A0A5M9JTP9_MONFR|nr:hypothetical protein EYC84_001992 [Monilinia fructicola]